MDRNHLSAILFHDIFSFQKLGYYDVGAISEFLRIFMVNIQYVSNKVKVNGLRANSSNEIYTYKLYMLNSYHSNCMLGHSMRAGK